jgi:hypothetical protein
MSEPDKENPKASKRSRRKPAMEPLGWDEIVSQPGMGGYLSFLNGPVPLPHLQGSATALYPDPGVGSIPQPDPVPAVISSPDLPSTPGPVSVRADSPMAPMAQAEQIPDLATNGGPFVAPVVVSTPETTSDPGADIIPAILSSPPVINDLGFVRSGPGVISIPAIPPGQRLRIRRCAATHDGHSLGEEVLYQALWKAAGPPESSETRTVVIGWRGMSQLCRMTPKNCKINTQRLIRKLALEVLSPYNTPESIGTTYRVYSDQAIFERRRAAGLEWVVRSRGVEFVDPATGISILPICAHTYQSRPILT